MTATKLSEDLLKRPWTPNEDARLRSLWSNVGRTVAEIAGALGRSPSAARRRACELGLKRGYNVGNAGNVVSPVIHRDGVAGKACVGPCREWRPLEKFARHATCAGGRRNVCTTCEGRVAREKNPERVLRNVRIYQERHPEVREMHRRASDARRRTKIGPHRGKHNVTVAELRAIRAVFGDACVYCGEPADTLDHLEPLARGGIHSVSNLVPACGTCNRSKKDKLLSEWSGPKPRKGA